MRDPRAETAAGAVSGRRADGLARFHGVPYAAAPVGALRFAPPRDPDPWIGVRRAADPGPIAPQPAGPLADPARAMREDCLVVDVVTPSLDGAAPVLVWLHGGGYFAGSSIEPDTDGERLAAEHGLVVVSVTHRLGLLGHLDLTDDGVPGSGNAGLLDLVAALRWVRGSIAAFGGDPGRITVAGHSGGGGKTSMLLAMPAARGALDGAVVMAGPEFDLNTVERARGTRDALLHELGIRAADPVDRLRDVPVGDLLGAQERLGVGVVPGPDSMRFSPVVGRPELPLSPSLAFATGVGAAVPTILGTARDEALIAVAGRHDGADAIDGTGAAAREPGEEELLEVIADGLDRPGDAAEAVRRYRGIHPGASRRELLLRMVSDQFRIRTIRMAEARERGGAGGTFVYRYDLAGPGGDAAHGAEVGAFFGHRGDGEAARTLARFARTGRPSGSLPSYSADSRHELRFADLGATVEADPDAAERRAWDGIPTGPASNPWARLLRLGL